MDTAFVTPISRKAKNRFANQMNENPECIVEQIKQNRVFLVSMNRKYCFWANLDKDSDWMIEL